MAKHLFLLMRDEVGEEEEEGEASASASASAAAAEIATAAKLIQQQT